MALTGLRGAIPSDQTIDDLAAAIRKLLPQLESFSLVEACDVQVN